MTIPALANSDPDPSSQLPWPRKNRVRDEVDATETESSTLQEQDEDFVNRQDPINKPSSVEQPGRWRLSTWDLFTLSIAMAGAQIAWTVELGYGTPFLLSLGLSEELTSLVWLAGPISGLIAQPVIGAISDSSNSRYRRRYWIVLSTIALVVSTLVLAYCQNISAFFVDFFGFGVGDWDPKRNVLVLRIAIAIAIISFYIMDFAINALQASLRNLLLDVTPPDQLNAGNAWHGRMNHAGNIVGFGFGFFPLAKLPVLRWLGGDQFRKFCVVAMAVLVVTVWITCYCHEEKERETLSKSKNSKFFEMMNNIHDAIVTLPKPIRRVCAVQLLAFMGWFPFLFYATTYIGQVMAYEHNEEPDKDYATRKGELAMLLYSIIAVVAGVILPHLAGRDRRLFVELNPDDEDAEGSYFRSLIREWRAEAARQGRPMRLPVMPFLLRNIWTGALLLFTLLMFSTFFITTVAQATLVVGLAGICWAVAIWVPFAIVMEFLKNLDPRDSYRPFDVQPRRPAHLRTISTPTPPSILGLAGRSANERQPLLRRRSFHGDLAAEADRGPDPIAGGTILGIHNLAIVSPQLIVAVVASLIFRIVDGESQGRTGHTYLGKNGVAWVLRFGGLCSLFGALVARRVPPTPSERQIRRKLGDLRDINENGNVP